jgi:hypothetical protein
MLEVTNIRVRSFSLDYLDIYWDLAPTYEDVLDYEFIVQTSDAEFGPYHDLTIPVVNLFHVRDITVKGRHSVFHKRYYRVIARKRADNSVTAFFPELGGVRMGAPADLFALEMARINNLKLREFMGRKVWVFPKKQSGQRCGVCWDRTMSRKTRSGCPSCFDTAWVGGFHPPVETWAAVISPAEATAQTNFARVASQNTTMLAGNYPELSEGDVVVEAENNRWRVGNDLQKIRKARALIRQQVSIHLIPSSDIEYTLPIRLSDEAVRDLMASPERNFTNPSSLEDPALTSALNSVFGRGRSS